MIETKPEERDQTSTKIGRKLMRSMQRWDINEVEHFEGRNDLLRLLEKSAMDIWNGREEK